MTVLGAGLLLRLEVVEPVVIATDSMEPTLRAGEHVLVVHQGGPPTARDIVMLEAPDGQAVVKRVVATAGQQVAIRDGRLVVDGHRVHEAYTDHRSIDGVYFGPVVVPPDAVFVLGDNRAGSRDSRVFGSVPEDRVEARVLAVLWPLSQAGRVR